jgi:hypothetical protein
MAQQMLSCEEEAKLPPSVMIRAGDELSDFFMHHNA